MERSQLRSFTDDYKRQAAIWWLQVAARSDRWPRNLAFATRFCGAIGNIKRAAVRCGSFRLHWTLPAITVAAKVDTRSHPGNADTHTATWTVFTISTATYESL